jgi:hypothetical protein
LVRGSTRSNQYSLSSLKCFKNIDMPLEIYIQPKFMLNRIKNINNTNWLELPSIDLIHIKDDPANIITICDLSCIVKGIHLPLELGDLIQWAYNKSFKNYQIPFYLDSLLRFSPYCQLSQPLPLNIDCTLGINVDYTEKHNNVTSKEKKTAHSHLLYFKKKPQEEKMSKHEGWIAIDFGTSNSTVTFYDPKRPRDVKNLSKEQIELFCDLLKDWLNSPLSKSLPEISDADWSQFLEQVNGNLKQPWSKILNDKNSSSLLEGIRQIEISLGTRLQEPLYLAVSKKLNEIYHKVFQEPPLQNERMISAQLEPNPDKPNQKDIISELELTNVNGFLKVNMGSVVKSNRLKTLAKQPSQDNPEKHWQEIEGKFHHSPKRYLYKRDERVDIYWEEQKKKIGYSELIQAAFERLIELTETFKDHENNREVCSLGNFYRVIVTYPTAARPEVRLKLEELIHQILEKKFTDTDITDIKVDVKRNFDEAISAAIFYLWREFGGNPTIGLEAFKTRCRRLGQKWAQNLLVLDIGGGTTDLALIRLKLEEIPAFEPGEEEKRGAGGRYYILTPDLMGSSGHLNLGGEYITLRLFRLLKVAIADNLLTAVKEEKLKNDKLIRIIKTLEEESNRFCLNGEYLSKSLLECIDKANPESDSFYKKVLNSAEEVLPTQWKKNQETRQPFYAFYTLWEWAEKAKISISEGASEYELPQNELTELLLQNEIDLNASNYTPIIKIFKDQLERAATPVVEEAINIAKKLLESRLPDELNSDESKEKKLDWLILSGQTCHLDLVRCKLHEIFSASDFEWNSARITFVPKYAKLATSIGACYGVTLQQRNLTPEGAREKLRRGISELDIKVNNLLSTLPCSFIQMVQGSIETIFNPQQKLYRFKPNEEAKVQSKWLSTVQPTITVRRQDFNNDNSDGIAWYNFVFEELAKGIGIYSDTEKYYEPFKVQFEVNQTLEIGMLFCKGNPHYLINDGSPNLKNLNKKISDALKTENLQEKVPQALILDGVLQWEIAVGLNEESPHSVFKRGEMLAEDFHDSENEKEPLCKGSISKDREQKPLPLPAFPRSAAHTFYACYPSLDNPILPPILLGILGAKEDKLKENYLYYVTIDDQGTLRLHEGEVPYWMCDKPQDLEDKEGCVFRANPSPIYERDNDERNPFCGLH